MGFDYCTLYCNKQDPRCGQCLRDHKRREANPQPSAVALSVETRESIRLTMAELKVALYGPSDGEEGGL